MILLTGAAGFIGSNILAALNARGIDDVIAVDDLTRGVKCRNLSGLAFADYLDASELVDAIDRGSLPALSAICHQGARADTTATDGRAVMARNHSFSKRMLALAERHGCPLVYASSASVYGDGRAGFRERPECERPASPYAFSKWVFDQHLRHRFRAEPPAIPVVGLRYFNVYGPRESHKGRMASVVFQCFEAIRRGEPPQVFEGSDAIERDFVHVDDVAAVNLHFLRGSQPGLHVLNVGTGVPRSFQALAEIAARVAGGPPPVTVPFPSDLAGQYQRFSRADLTLLRRAGYAAPLRALEEGIVAYHEAWRGQVIPDEPVAAGRRAA
jgi:ADP-L-glycero-D-manno-heptose 6-epimerase